MNKTTLQDLLTLARELPNLTADNYVRLCRLANKHRRLCEYACNVGMSDDEQRVHETRLADLHTKFTMLAIECGAKGDHEQRDPRGATLRLVLKSGRYNTLGGETWSL